MSLWPIATGRFWATAALLAGLGAASTARPGEDPPALSPPAGSPPLEAPASLGPSTPAPIPAPAETAPAAPPPRPPAARGGGPVLALPGVTAPRPRPAPPASLPPPTLAPSADGGLPALEMPGTPKPASAAAGSTTLIPLPSERFRGRVIESVPADPLFPPLDAPTAPSTPPPPGRRTTPRPGMAPTPMPPVGPPRRTGTRNDPEPIDGPDLKDFDDLREFKDFKDFDGDKKPGDDRPSPSPPARRPGLFGGRLNPFAPPRNSMTNADSPIRAEPRTDPAADAAIRRRVEKQAHDAVGDRARSLDVRVVGRSITIQARGVRPLQRRGVRRSLETLPGLSGYRSTVEVLD